MSRSGGRRTHRLVSTGPLVSVLPRPAVLADDEALGVRHVRRAVHGPQGDEVVQPLPGVTSACYAHSFGGSA
jgi:hypothetical protein